MFVNVKLAIMKVRRMNVLNVIQNVLLVTKTAVYLVQFQIKYLMVKVVVNAKKATTLMKKVIHVYHVWRVVPH
eukprot:jgi/Orpsp1_1/1179748/evm.model.c7180000070616.2